MQTTTVDDLSAVHACAVPGSDEQLWEMSARFLGVGLTRGEHAVYFDDGTIDAVLERLVDDHVPVDRPLADGLARERAAFFGLFDTDDQAEGMAAFTQKRPPVWSGH